MKLHLGCGGAILPGFINIDARQLPGVDDVDNICTLEKYKEGTISLIYASHVLEHVGRLEYMRVLKRWYDLLEDGGVLRIAVPDMEMVCKHYMVHKDIKILRGFIYGGQTYPGNYHYCGWDAKALRDDLIEVGFKDVCRYDWKEVEENYVNDYSKSYLPHDSEAVKTGNFSKHQTLMSLNIHAYKKL